jgi:hypothetical protein
MGSVLEGLIRRECPCSPAIFVIVNAFRVGLPNPPATGPIVSGLILESHFELEALSEKALRRILGRIFDALFPGNR